MIYIALENVRSLYNIGAIFRTCSFFGFYNILLVGYSGRNFDTLGESILHEGISKTALGTEKDMDIQFLDSAEDLINFSITSRTDLISVEQSVTSTPLTARQPRKNIILVFGNEVEGVSQKVLNASKQVVEIPRLGKHNSLNITTSCGIALYALRTLQDGP